MALDVNLPRISGALNAVRKDLESRSSMVSQVDAAQLVQLGQLTDIRDLEYHEVANLAQMALNIAFLLQLQKPPNIPRQDVERMARLGEI